MASAVARRRTGAKRGRCWKSRLLFLALAIANANSQDISACCAKATGTCRSVCEKMSLVEIASNASMREERIQNIYKFCTPTLIEFWICMNVTIQEVVSGSGWWGRACCALGRSTPCRQACATAAGTAALSSVCRRSDEIAFFNCVKRQEEAQACCSQTQSLTCHEACQRVLWRVGTAHVELNARERAVEACEQSAPLLHCLRDLTASTVHADASKYLPCCHESPSQECRSTCESVLRRTGDSGEIAEALNQDCGAPAIHDGLWQCFLRRAEPPDTKDLIPRDIAKLHCCSRATTINCRRLCFNTFNTDWPNNFEKFDSECLGNPQETDLTQCIEEVEAPCSLGCAGLTYCSQLNNRPTSLFRSCSAQADLDAHLAVAEQKDSGSVKVSGLTLPLKNSTQCPTDIWKNVACALHVKPCTAKGHASLLCAADCTRLVSSCVEWSRAPPALNAAALCARLAPADPAAPCVSLTDYMSPSTHPPLLSSREAVTSPCAGSPCNATQVCVVNRNCLHGGSCSRYTCVEGCPLGDGSPIIVPIGSWARVPMTSPSGKACFKICHCTAKGLGHCQPLPCVALDNCRLHEKVITHGEKYYMECNACACVLGERVCARRACGRAALLTGLPCNCPPHHLPVAAPGRRYPNACLAKCAGATDAEIEFGIRSACAGASCGRRTCLPARNVCLSRLQANCPQHICVNTSHCNAQPPMPVCDTDGHTHDNPCQLVLSGNMFAYWGQCLERCSKVGHVCGANGITYISECAAWAEYVSVDYRGPCLAVGPISDLMEPKCEVDRIICPPLIQLNCLGFTPPGACCPKCGGALRILYSKKQIDRALYGTNISSSVINLKNVLSALERQVKIAECALRGYLTIETEIFVTVETILENPTNLQLRVCVLEAEKLAELINRESPIISSDLGLSALSYALTVHTYPTKGASSVSVSLLAVMISSISIFVLR
ncbi:reversion-inducing cysteine-rich protein with Kazal motifs isoform X1 [Leguminivora glycinivorella]|uniref:reversion-inducing cysteine-rich protein with Kazal motifs isoform X1 n=1 Tax=Leguminivora glycinivorella TaxID=1035111 RepID=UPI00200BC4B9|nr:reversion-inducing cysteine-rich protein with Kazal motifs isoform X1 [Leguminivora glycinivorella]XP_047992882.1 reversion-inducing cysteine-rich protein with Kazal motifs isoform X1 [Leguminivora glycinivorella]XP_047992883.1 reversion-inducing cysteine-rich protein with Kazal motifs isoform X1 [Leguminivora glycinivorella]